MSIFIDTSGFLAVLDQDDASYAAAAKTWVDILTSEEALAQIRDGDYARKYRGGSRPVKRVGVAFDSAARNLAAWLAADA